jgi:ribosomal protein S18 acetylase RimI-like enzyme
MTIHIRYGTEHLNYQALCELIRLAPLGERDPAKMQKAAENSYVVCSAYLGTELVGFGRAISDGQYQAAIYDIVVLPHYQGKGIGRQVMQALLDKLPEGSLSLIYVVPGKQKFYEKFGFGNLTTGMGRFADPEKARRNGYLAEEVPA